MEDQNTGQQDLGTETAGLPGPVEGTGGDPGESTQAAIAEFEIQRDGQVVKVPFDQAKDYVQKGYDYTQKTMELARERDTLKPYQEVSTFLQANPDIAKLMVDAYTRKQQGLDLQGQDIDPVQQKIAMLEMQTNQLVMSNAKQQLDNFMGQINSDEKYEGLFKDPEVEELLLSNVLAAKQPLNFDGLKVAADRIHKKILSFKVESEKAGEKKVVENLKSPTRKSETGQGTFSPPKGFDPAKADWKDIHARAVEML